MYALFGMNSVHLKYWLCKLWDIQKVWIVQDSLLKDQFLQRLYVLTALNPESLGGYKINKNYTAINNITLQVQSLADRHLSFRRYYVYISLYHIVLADFELIKVLLSGILVQCYITIYIVPTMSTDWLATVASLKWMSRQSRYRVMQTTGMLTLHQSQDQDNQYFVLGFS